MERACARVLKSGSLERRVHELCVLFRECRWGGFRATPAAQKNFHFFLAIPKRFAIVSRIEGNQSDEQPKKQMQTQIITAIKADEVPAILNPKVRARMLAAIEKWDNGDGDAEGEFMAHAGYPVQFVVRLSASCLDQADALIRRVHAAIIARE